MFCPLDTLDSIIRFVAEAVAPVARDVGLEQLDLEVGDVGVPGTRRSSLSLHPSPRYIRMYMVHTYVYAHTYISRKWLKYIQNATLKKTYFLLRACVYVFLFIYSDVHMYVHARVNSE